MKGTFDLGCGHFLQQACKRVTKQKVLVEKDVGKVWNFIECVLCLLRDALSLAIVNY